MYIFKKCLIVFAAIAAVDITTGVFGRLIIDELNKKNYSGQAALFGYNLQGAKADIVVLGSSTASCHYVPRLLSDKIGALTEKQLTAFNAGAYYQQSSYPYCVLKGMIERGSRPQIVILDIQPQQLGESINDAALKPMRPYYDINQNVKEVLDASESFWNRILLNSGMFRFNTEIVKLLASFRNPIGADGFDPKEGEVDSFVVEPRRDDNDLNPLFVSEFDSTLQMAVNNNIEMYVIMSPRLSYVDTNSKSYRKIIELCGKYDIRLYDLSSDVDFQNGNLFCDNIHLNSEGAKKFTLKLINIIRRNSLRTG